MSYKMPNADEYTGLSRKVLQYSEAFAHVLGSWKSDGLSEADWAPLEALVDVDAFEREGVFLTAKAEVIGWKQYKAYISEYASGTSWEGKLRHITETHGRVILEMEEINTRNGAGHVSRTVTIYEFTAADRLKHLEVFVMPLG